MRLSEHMLHKNPQVQNNCIIVPAKSCKIAILGHSPFLNKPHILLQINLRSGKVDIWGVGSSVPPTLFCSISRLHHLKSLCGRANCLAITGSASWYKFPGVYGVLGPWQSWLAATSSPNLSADMCLCWLPSMTTVQLRYQRLSQTKHVVHSQKT